MNSSLDKLCKDYGLDDNISKSKMDHNKITKDNYMDYYDEWSPYLKLDCISLASVWIRYLNTM